MAQYNSSNNSFVSGNRSLIEVVMLADSEGNIAASSSSSASPIISTDNSLDGTANSALAAANTWYGEWEAVNNYASISVIGISDQAGTLYCQFSMDGVTVDRNIQLSSESADYGIHSLIPVAKYFRIRITQNSTTPSTYIRLQTIYNDSARFAMPTSRLGQNISTWTDVINTRAIVSDVDGKNAIVTDQYALQVTFPKEGKSSFAELLTASIEPQVQVLFNIYNDSDVLILDEYLDGLITNSNNNIVVYSGANTDSSAYVETKERVRYHPGQGVRARFTGLYTNGYIGTTQTIGIGDRRDGYFFGYHNDDFGILHRRFGEYEVRTLTITTASSQNEQLSITLDGATTATVNVSSSGNITTTVNEIASYDYSGLGNGWDAYPMGNKVMFISRECGPKSNAYAMTMAISANGSFTQNIAGVLPEETWVPQSDWNQVDKFDGNGVTGITINPQMGNVYQVAYQYLGYGSVYFYIEDQNDGEFHCVHILEYANLNEKPSLGNPHLPLSIESKNISNNAGVTVKSASMAGFTDGQNILLGKRFAHSDSITLGATTAETPIASFMVKLVFKDKLNNSNIKINRIALSADHTKPIFIKMYKNPTLTGASWSNKDPNSIVETDSSATAFSEGQEVYSFALSGTGTQLINLSDDKLAAIFNPGDIITFTIAPTSVNGAGAAISVSWVELV